MITGEIGKLFVETLPAWARKHAGDIWEQIEDYHPALNACPISQSK